MQWLDQSSGDSPAMRRLLNNNHPDRRMADAELMLRHLAFSESSSQYQGNLKQFLDDTSRYFNKNWMTLRPVAESALNEFEAALITGIESFGRDAFCRKWSMGAESDAEGHFERSLNRAVFDVQVFSLSIPEVRSRIVPRASQVLDEFKKMCVDDVPFSRSITSTTKTLEAFNIRHRRWRQIIESQCEITYDLPQPLARA